MNGEENMTFLPSVERELRVAARRRATYWTRVGSALLGMCIVGWIMIVIGGHDTPAELGKGIFISLSVLEFIYCLLIGVRNTSDCISEEKREGTLGLLFLTDLKGYDVVLGKLVATSLNSFYGLLALFPIMAIPLLLGGMTLQQFGQMILLLTNTLFFSLAVGIWVSTMGRNERRTASMTFALILFFAGGMPLLGYWATRLFYDELFGVQVVSAEWMMIFLLPSPGYAIEQLFQTWRATVDPTFWWSVLTTHVIAWGFVVSASARLPHVWQDKAPSAAAVRWRDRWQQWCYGNGEERQAFRRRLMSINPFYWLAGRDRLKPMLVWAFLGLVAAGWLWGYFEERKDWLDYGWCIVTALVLHTFLRLWLASEACQRFGQDRQSGALELILATPLSVADILRGQMLALRRQFLWPVVAVLVVDFLFLLANAGKEHWWVWLCLAAMVMLVADMYAISWLGMWLGLRARHASRASGAVIARILLLPWAIILGLVTMLNFVDSISGSLISSGFRWRDDYFLPIWFAVGVLTDVTFTAWAKGKLRHEFRAVATQRVDAIAPRRKWLPSARKKAGANQPPVIR